MPNPKDGEAILYVFVPEEVKSALQGLAKRNQRSLKAECALALRRHLADPLLPLEPASYSPPRKRGRPKKTS